MHNNILVNFSKFRAKAAGFRGKSSEPREARASVKISQDFVRNKIKSVIGIRRTYAKYAFIPLQLFRTKFGKITSKAYYAKDLMILIFITCKNTEEAGNIGRMLVKKRLAACSMVIPDAMSFYWWPPKKGIIEESREAILLLKTVEKNFSKIEKEIKKTHSYEVPCILSIPITKAHNPYLKWLKGEVK